METVIRIINDYPDAAIDEMFDSRSLAMANTGMSISSENIASGLAQLEKDNPDLIRAFSKK